MSRCMPKETGRILIMVRPGHIHIISINVVLITSK